MRLPIIAACAAVLFATLPHTANASMRTQSGQLIREGDAPVKLIQHLGHPASKSFATTWCDSRKKAVCTEETWVYFEGQKVWTIKILNNEITDIQWTRQ